MKENFQKEGKKNSIKQVLLPIVLAIFVVLFASFYYTKFAKIISPLGVSFDSSVNVMNEIVKPKIEKIPNNYSLYTKKSPFVPQASASMGEYSLASAYILTDFESGEILLEKNANEILPIASLTKVMTAVIALDLASESEVFSVTPKAARVIPTKLGVIPHEKLTVEELLGGILLTSANDAAQVIVDGIDNKYMSKVFIDAMNEKAKFIGLTNTSFTNPQGFDSRKNFSTASDLAILTHYAMANYPLISETVKKEAEFLPKDQNHKQFDLPNWNGLIGVYPSTIGMKIGNTERAGKTTIVVSNRGGKKLIAIVLGAPGIVERDLWASQILDYGYEKTLGLPPTEITKDQLLDKYQTWHN